MSKEVQDMPETSDREKENLLRKRGLLAGVAILSMAVLLAAGCKKKDIPESSTTLAESDVSMGELSGGDGSSETAEKQPMSPEEIAEKAYAVRWFDYFSLDQADRCRSDPGSLTIILLCMILLRRQAIRLRTAGRLTSFFVRIRVKCMLRNMSILYRSTMSRWKRDCWS